MAERHRLLARHHSAGFVGAAVQRVESPGEKSDDENRAENGNARERVRAVMKDLGHSLTSVPAVWLDMCKFASGDSNNN